jgi:hypothetical protein
VVVCAEHAACFFAAFGETPLELSAGILLNRAKREEFMHKTMVRASAVRRSEPPHTEPANHRKQ